MGSFSRVWLVLAHKLETHFDKFHIECRWLASSKPHLLVRLLNILLSKNSYVTTEASRQILSYISNKVLQEL